MNEKWKSLLELGGILILSASLLFVGLQMQLDRKIAIANLNSERANAFASRHLAGIESDPYLEMYYANYRTNSWDTGELDDKQIAAAELDALVWWSYANQTFAHRKEGLVPDREWNDFKEELENTCQLPAYAAVYDYWWKRAPSEFTEFVDGVIQEK